MSNKQDKWEKLINLTDDYTPDPNLANEVLAKINQRESTVQFKKPLKIWIPLVSFIFICAVCLSIFLPIYFSKSKNGNIYYSSENIEFEPIDDVDGFIKDNNLKVYYYSDAMATTQSAVLKENKELLYIKQDLFYFSEAGLDTLSFRIVLLPNAEFEFYKDYESLSSTLIISGLDIHYVMDNAADTIVIRAKFKSEGITYFLEVACLEESTKTLENYIKLLIK